MGAVRAPESECGVFSTYCTVGTFGGVQGGSLPQGHWVGVAGMDKVTVVARMYYEFEKELVSPPLSPISHRWLIANGMDVDTSPNNTRIRKGHGREDGPARSSLGVQLSSSKSRRRRVRGGMRDGSLE